MALEDLGDSLNRGTDSSTDREYVQPTLAEMKHCLAKFNVDWKENTDMNTNEYVYETHDFAPTHNGVVLQVYTTIDKRTDKARGKGSDAIRLTVYHRHSGRFITGRKKTLRIKTWEKNLTEKIQSLLDEGEAILPKCEECGSIMLRREGKFGEFLGCSSYPECQHTREV